MQENLDTHRRILVVAYRRYLAADRALQTARSTALGWFPDPPARGTTLIGDPGSRIRRLYERRDLALARLELARRALKEAQSQRRARPPRPVCLIGVRRSAVFRPDPQV